MLYCRVTVLDCLKSLLCVHAFFTGPPDPVTNLVVSSIGEREVSLSWLTRFTGSSPIAIEMDVFPATGSPFSSVLGNVNATTVNDLMPFREYNGTLLILMVEVKLRTSPQLPFL